jgi:hypothetical protein
MQPTNRNLLGFEAQTKKPSWWFWSPNHQTVAADFEAQTRKPVLVVLRSNNWQTIDLSFESKLRNPCSSSPCARCKPHRVSLDLSIIRPSCTWPVLDYPRSSAPGLLLMLRSSSLPAMSHLSPAHYKTSKCHSLTRIDNKGRTTETSWIQIQTKATQLLITYQTKVLVTWFLNLPLDECIDNKRHKVWNMNPIPMKHS